MLTEAEIKKLRPGLRPRVVPDADNLFLVVRPSGTLSWRMRYQFAGADRALALGEYPVVKLADARAKRTEARVLIQKGIDPLTVMGNRKRRDEAAAARAAEPKDSFKLNAEEWWKNKRKELSETTIVRDERILNKVIAQLGDRSLLTLVTKDLVDALRAIEKNPHDKSRPRAETTHRALGIIRNVYAYAKATGIAAKVEELWGIEKALAPVVEKHYAAITDHKRFGELLRAIDHYHGEPATVAALRLLPLLFTRQQELRFARWKHFDLDNARWIVPSKDVKTGQDHVVFLPRQAVKILRDHRAATYRGDPGSFVFPAKSKIGRPLSENTVRCALGIMGFGGEMVGHGFRTTASTLLHDNAFDSLVVERQLGHVDSNKVRRAYNRSERALERKEMLQAWADYLDVLRDGGNVIEFPRKKARNR